MEFYLYLFLSLLIILFLLVFVFSFGLPYFKGAPYAATTKNKINQILSLLSKRIKEGQVADLGSGDGRLVLALAQQGYQVQGYEINPVLSYLSQTRIKRQKIEDKAVVSRKDYWKQDLSNCQAVVVFGVFYIMPKLERKLQRELKPGAIVVSNYFKFPNWEPQHQENGIYIYVK